MSIYNDIKSGEVTAEQLVRAMATPGNFRYVGLSGISSHTSKFKLNNGTTKEYDSYDFIGMMQKVVCAAIISKIDSYRFAYSIKKYPDYKLPDDAEIDEIEKTKKLIDEATDKYLISQGIRDKFLAEHNVNSDDIEKNIEWLKIKNDFEDGLYETNIIHVWVELFMTVNVLENCYKRTPFEEHLTEYKTGIQDFLMVSSREVDYIDEDFSLIIFSTLLRKKSSVMRLLNEKKGIKPLSDADVISYIERYIEKEDFERFIAKYGDCILDRKSVVEYLTTPQKNQNENSKAGLMTKDEFIEKVNKFGLDNQYMETHDRGLIQYMTHKQIVKLYADGNIENRDVRKFITVDEILDLPIDKEIKLNALMRGGSGSVLLGEHSEKIWNMLESGEFTVEDIKKLEKYEFFSIDTIIKQYIDNSTRKIAAELGELPQISEDNLFKYFTPDMILKNLDRITDDTHAFYKDMLKSIYEKNGSNLDETIRAELSKEKDKSVATEKACRLYRDGIVKADILKDIGMSEDEIIQFVISNKNDESLLIDIFNSGLVSGFRMFEDVLDMDTDLAYELIGKGMSAKVIAGLESTATLIDMTRAKVDEDGKEISPKLNYENLAEIKEDINTGIDEKGSTKVDKNSSTLLDLYLSDSLSYSELYSLAEAGVITVDIANEINEKYNLIKDWETLKDVGVKGSPIETLLTSELGESASNSMVSKGVIGIDEDCIIDLYLALGAKEYLEVDAKECPVFKDYIIIPVMEKKVAYLEGKDGRTYIVPLKIVFEQINNPKGDMDLIGNAQSRTAFNSQKKHIRSANHTRNWGRNVVEKTADLPSVPMDKEDAKKFIAENLATIKAIEKSYDDRKYTKFKNDEQQM